MLGGDPWADAVRLHRSIAYVPGDVTLWPNLTGGEAIDILCRLSGPLDPGRKQVMLERFDLDPTKKARAYSKGNRQKVALVAALASTADLLLLDEPTSGLDPLMEAAFTESIREVKAEGRSVLLSSHIFAEVERLADQVTIIRDGVTVESGTIAQLRHLTRSQLTVVLDRGADGLAALPGVHDLQQLDGHVTFAVDDAELPSVLAAVAALAPAVPGGQPAVAGGAVPAPLRHRARRAERGRAMTTATQPTGLVAAAGHPATGLGHVRRHGHDDPPRPAAQPGPPRRVVGRARRPVRLRRGLLPRHLHDPDRRSTTSRPSATSPRSRRSRAWRPRPNTLGGAVWTKIWMTCALSLAFGVVFLVTRNGRADEELGRTELLRSRMLGLHAYSVASWSVNAALCVAVGVGIALVSAAGGLDPAGAGITGSLIVGASMTGVGLVAIGVGAARRPGDLHLARRERARLGGPGCVLPAADDRRPR